MQESAPCMIPACFVASTKVPTLINDSNNYLYFHYKDKAYNTQATYRSQKYRNGRKAVAVLQMESNEQVYLDSN